MLITILNGLALAALLFSLSVGFSLIFGTMRIVNLAHGSLFLIGAYIGVIVMQSGTATAFVLALGIAVVAGAVLGIGLWAMLRPLQQRGFFPQALLTIGVSFIVGHLLHTFASDAPIAVSPPDFLAGTVSILGTGFPVYRIALIAFGLVLAAAVYLIVERSRVGALLKASTSDPMMARALGINVRKITAGVFAFGSVLAVLGGTIGAPLMGAYVGLDHQVLLLALVVVVIGGLGSTAGAAIGSIAVGQIQTLGVALLPDLTPFLLFGSMMLVLLVRPQGLLGKKHHEASSIVTVTRAVMSSWRTRSTAASTITGVVFVVALALIPLFASRFFISEFSLILAFGVLALTFDLLLGISGIASFAHVAYFGVGAYVAGIAAVNGFTNAPLLLLASTVAAAIAALATSWVPLRAKAVTFVMITLAMGQLAQSLASSLRGLTGGTDGLTGVPPLTLIPGVDLRSPATVFWFVLTVSVIMYLVVRMISRSPFGRTLRGLRDNEPRMTALGYSTLRYKYAILVIASALAGTAGALWIAQARYVSPADMGFSALIFLLMVLVIGGTGSLWGAFAGATVVFLTRDVLSSAFLGSGPLILGIVLLLAVYLFPGGIASIRLPQAWVDRITKRKQPAVDAQIEVNA